MSIDIANISAKISSMSAEQFLKDLLVKEETSITSVALPMSLVEFLDEVSVARKISRSAVLRAILTQMKESWDQMTPAQKRGAAYE